MRSSPSSPRSRRATSACPRPGRTSRITTGIEMRIAAMGAGGVGGYFGARLQEAGHNVAFLARGRHLAALKKDGLTLESPLGDARLKIKVFERPAEIGPVDVVMFAVKLWDTESAAESLRPI